MVDNSKQMIQNKITSIDIKNVYNSQYINWELFKNKTFFITGATGVIGSFIIRCLLNANKQSNLNIKIVAAVRNIDSAVKFFRKKRIKTDIFELYECNVINEINYRDHVDYIIHAACNTSSNSFISNPVETFNVSVKGIDNILKFAKRSSVESIIYLSSMEVYGNISSPRQLNEHELGSLDIDEIRSSYPMGKRAAESLCYYYSQEYNLPIKVVRLAQVIGANVPYDDTRVFAQFARSIVERKNIILNTNGETTRSYCYITDVISAILTILVNGKNGECYNIANEESAYKICDIAKFLCDKYPSSNLQFKLKESNQYYKTTHWILDNSKLKALGWKANVSLESAYGQIISSFYYQKDTASKNISKPSKIKKNRNYNKDNFFEQIFSVKNKGKYKIIKVFGLKVKINLTKTYMDLPIEPKKIVFSNFSGNGYACNPKYIAEEIIQQNLPYELVWLVKDPNDEEIRKSFPSCIRLAKYSYKDAMKELASAKIWIDNQRKNSFIKRGLCKKNGQFYIQTWHGGLGFKKFDGDLPAEVTAPYIELSQMDSSLIDYLLSNSKFEDNVFKSAFWYNGQILKVGHPRNDIFFKSEKDLLSIKNKIHKRFGLNDSNKIFLYIPSFRDNLRLDCYMLDIKSLRLTLEENFGGSWTILIRMHPKLKNVSNSIFNYDNDVINVSSYPDVQELLVAADIAMTDYSSCIFDFMLSRKPAFIFATDIEKFYEERGFYYPLEQSPFPVARNNKELLENIRKFDNSQYQQDINMFLQEKGCIESGTASKQVVELIKTLMEGQNE